MAQITEAMNEWGREFLRRNGYEVADDANITFEDDWYDIGYCETCSYICYAVEVSDGVNTSRYEGDMGEMIRSMNEGVYY